MKVIRNKLKNGFDLSQEEVDFVIRAIEYFDPVVILCDEGYYLAPNKGVDDDIENAHVYPRAKAEEILSTWPGKILSV